MKNTLKTLAAFCLLLIIGSCGTKRKATEPITISETKEVRIVERDTVVLTKADSVQTIVQIDCTDKETPKIKTVSQTPGRILRPTKLTLNGNQLTIDCKAEAEKIALKLYDNYVKEHKKEVVLKEVEKPFKWYHKALMWVGVFTLVFITIGALLTYFKPKF